MPASLRKYFLLILVSIVNLSVFAQKDTTQFVTTWRTNNPGISGDSSIFLNIDPNHTFNFDVDWDDDGVFDSLGVTKSITHRYSDTGTYTIRIRGQFPRITFGTDLNFTSNYDCMKLISIDQWGTQVWQQLNEAFQNCINVKYNATDVPDLSNVNDLSYMFRLATSFNGDLSNWDVSNIENMAYLFSRCSSFDGDLSTWDVSKTKNMSFLFNLSNFNQNIGSWTVDSVVNMRFMFASNAFFNQDIGNWNVGSVTSMQGMFAFATTFNQDIGSWDVSSVIDMESMFIYASSFNYDLNNWNTSSVVRLNSIFHGASSFNGNINNWDVDSITNFTSVFDEATNFNQDISNWDVSSGADFTRMFTEASSFNQDLSTWNLDTASNMLGMFYKATAFDQDLSNWNIRNVTDLNFFLDSSGMSITNYDKLLTAWQSKASQNSLNIGVAGLEYCLSDSIRTELINNRNWTFQGDRKNCTTVGLAESTELNTTFKTYPNPTTGLVNLELNTENPNSKEAIYLYDQNARLVNSYPFNGKQVQIDLSNYPNGLYLLRYQNNTQKVMLAH